MKLRVLLTIALASLAAAVSAEPARLHVSLALAQDRTLPALSVPLSLRVRNGARALELAASVTVRATSPAGESFLALWEGQQTFGELDFGRGEEDDPRLILPPHGTIDLEVPALDFTRPSWASDARLAQPGQWSLEVLLYEAEHREPAGISNRVALTIEPPSGADAAAWEALRTEGIAAAERIVREHPDSRYVPYLSTWIARVSILEKVAIIGRAIELHPRSPVVPRLRYAIALYYGMEADRVFAVEGDLEKAVALAEKGRAELNLLARSKSVWSRLEGREKLRSFPSRAYFVQLQRLKAKRAPAPR